MDMHHLRTHGRKRHEQDSNNSHHYAAANRHVGSGGSVGAGVGAGEPDGATLITLSLALVGEGAPGGLDPTFGDGGRVTTDFGASDAAFALVLQPDGKLVAAGGTGAGRDFALARYRR